METTNMILLLAFMGYSIMEGWREGIYWHIKRASGFRQRTKYNEHQIWTIQRFIVVVALGWAMTGLFTDIIQVGYFVFAMALMFPFLHDGTYYLKRERLKEGTYPRGFIDHSKTSTAFSTKFFPFWNRLLCFAIGLVMMIYGG